MKYDGISCSSIRGGPQTILCAAEMKLQSHTNFWQGDRPGFCYRKGLWHSPRSFVTQETGSQAPSVFSASLISCSIPLCWVFINQLLQSGAPFLRLNQHFSLPLKSLSLMALKPTSVFPPATLSCRQPFCHDDNITSPPGVWLNTSHSAIIPSHFLILLSFSFPVNF